MANDVVRLDGIVLCRETDKARLCRDADLTDHELNSDPEDANHWWFPKSQTIETNLRIPGDRGFISIARWLAAKKKLLAQ